MYRWFKGIRKCKILQKTNIGLLVEFLDNQEKAVIVPRFLWKYPKLTKEELELTKFPCPKCGVYYTPEQILKTKAIMKCKEHGLFEIDINRSLNFRRFCSEIASKPNRSPFYYSSTELKIKKALEILKKIFFHNVGIELNNRKYWLDFLVLNPISILSVNPSVWHKLWNREKSDKIKYQELIKLNIPVIVLEDKILNENLETITSFLEMKFKEVKQFE